MKLEFGRMLNASIYVRHFGNIWTMQISNTRYKFTSNRKRQNSLSITSSPTRTCNRIETLIPLIYYRRISWCCSKATFGNCSKSWWFHMDVAGNTCEFCITGTPRERWIRRYPYVEAFKVNCGKWKIVLLNIEPQLHI